MPDALVAQRTAGIVGLGTALPPRSIPSAAIAARVGLDESWILERTGIRSRRVADPDARLSDLAAAAGAEALWRAGIEAADLDLVLVATMSQDELTPNTAPLVAHALGAARAGAFDVGAACNAFLSALVAGAAFVESGRADRVLVIGADLISRFTDHDDAKTAALFADGAGAVVLGAGTGRGISASILRQDGAHAETIIARRDRGLIEMDGPETFRHAVNRLTEVTLETAEAAGVPLEEIDLFVYHQANARITRALGSRLGLDPDVVVDSIAELGNTSAATLPLALAHAEAGGRLRTGTKVLLAAFGAGFAWGGAVLEW